MKKIFANLMLILFLAAPAYSACTVTGGACSINDIISSQKKENKKTENKKTENKKKIKSEIKPKEQKKEYDKNYRIP